MPRPDSDAAFAYDRLRALPPVLTIETAARGLGLSRDSVKVSMARWARLGLVAHAGPRAGVYYNRVREPDAPRTRLAQAVLYLHPQALLTGPSVLYASGWSEEIPGRGLTVAVPDRSSIAGLYGVDLIIRPQAWFQAAMESRSVVSPGSDMETLGLPATTPAWALADARHYGDWRPAPGDLIQKNIDWRAVERAQGAMPDLAHAHHDARTQSGARPPEEQ